MWLYKFVHCLLLIASFISIVSPQNAEHSPIMPGISRMRSSNKFARMTNSDQLGSHGRGGPIFFPVSLDESQAPPVNLRDESSLLNAEEDSLGLFELPEDMDLENIDASPSELEIINSLQSLEDFTRTFGVSMPKEAVDETDAGFAPRFGLRSAAVEGLNAVCAPENKTVRLDLPRQFNVVYFPRCVRLMRCGGCCHGPLLTCQPTQTTPVKLKILKVDAGSSSRTSIRNTPRSDGRTRTRTRTRTRGGNRRRREETTSYYEVDEVHHSACKCQCRIKEDDCDPSIQTYSENECMCRCKNSDEQSKCSSKGSTHYWDNKSCRCFCHKEESCSTGQRFDHASCSCVKLPNGLFRSGLAGRSGVGPAEGLLDTEINSSPINFNF